LKSEIKEEMSVDGKKKYERYWDMSIRLKNFVFYWKFCFLIF